MSTWIVLNWFRIGLNDRLFWYRSLKLGSQRVNLVCQLSYIVF
jgi:hypothetical protein